MLPTIRSAVEKQLNLIAQGKADYRQVLGHTLDIFKRKFHYFVDSIAGKVCLFSTPGCQVPPCETSPQIWAPLEDRVMMSHHGALVPIKGQCINTTHSPAWYAQWLEG